MAAAYDYSDVVLPGYGLVEPERELSIRSGYVASESAMAGNAV
jgi:hypothetical protein